MTVRAAEVRTCGSPPVLTTRDEPVARDGEVLVRVETAPIVPLDLLCASGTSYFGEPATPYVPGVQGVGTTDRGPVWFATSAGMAPGDGSMAEVVVVPEADVVPLPDGVDPVAVAALGLSGVAAHEALLGTGALQAGETVLVLGAGGVVGQAAVQLARVAGAGRVVGAARSEAGRERARQAGADEVVALEADDVADLARRIAEVTGPVDLVLDPLWGAPAVAAAHCLRPGGRLVNLGSSAGETSALDSATIRSRTLQVLGYTNNALTTERRAAAVRAVAELALAGRLAVAHEVWPFADVAAAWQRQAQGEASGRIVLSTAL